MKKLGHTIRWAVAAAAALAGLVRADIIHLRSGKVEGTIVTRTKTELVVETAAGKVTLDPADVVKIERKSSPLELYREMARTVGEQDAEGHFRLGRWCLDQRLFGEANREFRTTIALDPDHKQARARLGYVLRDGKWMTRAEARRADGFVRHNDEWVTEEQRDNAKSRQALVAWRKRLRRVIAKKPTSEGAVARRVAAALGDKPREAAHAALRSLLGDMTKEAGESRRDHTCAARAALVRAVADEGSAEAIALLRRTAIADDDEAVRSVAVEALAPRKDIDDTAYFVRLLREFSSVRYRVLGDKKSRRLARRVLRRAARVLGRLGDPRAVPALANAMVVCFHIAEDKDDPPPMTIGFSSSTLVGGGILSDGQGNQFVTPISEGSNFGLGGSQPEKRVESGFFFNEDAYFALRKLTGKDFGQDKRAWLAWWYRNRHELAD